MVSLKYDGTDGPVKMDRLHVPSLSPVSESLVFEQSYLSKYSALVLKPFSLSRHILVRPAFNVTF